MNANYPRDFLSSADLLLAQYLELIDLAADLKRNRYDHPKKLSGLNVGIFSTKPSLRTRLSFEIAINELGGNALFIRNDEIGLGTRESYEDVAQVLSRYLAAFIVRSNDQVGLHKLAEHATIPIINALTDQEHPCQILADLLTLHERFGDLKGLKLAYIGDGNNVSQSLMLASAIVGIELTVITPPGHEPNNHYLDLSQKLAAKSEHVYPMVCNDISLAKGMDALYTDVWHSMGQEGGPKQAFKGYQVNADIIGDRQISVMHCLPAHKGEEISEETFEQNAKLIFDQAENRLHAQKALLYKLFE